MTTTQDETPTGAATPAGESTPKLWSCLHELAFRTRAHHGDAVAAYQSLPDDMRTQVAATAEAIANHRA